MKIIIGKTARLPGKFIKNGSLSDRYKCVQELEDKFYQRIQRYKSAGKDAFEYINKAYSYVLEGKNIIQTIPLSPEKANFSVVYPAENAISKNGTRNILGYIVELLVNRTDEQFAGVFTDTLMHETDHLFSYLTNPKYVTRIIKVSQNSTTAENCEKFFINNIQSPVNINSFERKLNRFVKNEISKSQLIDILQNFRYKTINEINAYNTGKKYLFKERLSNPERIYPQYHDQVEIQNLRGKFDILNEVLRKTLQTERKEIQTKNAEKLTCYKDM